VFGSQEMVSYLQRLCGYWATGVIREQSLPILWGHGSNGKTTFLNAIMEVFGSDYAMKSPSNFLMAKTSDSHPTDKADLFGRRVVICSETEDGKRLDEPLVKELTGDEPIRARRMREDFWEFTPTHKILLVTNHLPRIRGTDHGIWRRIRRVSFAKKFWNPDIGETGPPELKQDPTLKDDIKAEHQGILSWIIRGTLAWLHDGEQAPVDVRGSTGEYRAEQDVLGSFLAETCLQDKAVCCEASDLYKAYKKWTEENGEYCLPQRQFGMAMTERGFDRYRNNGFWYRGVCLSTSVGFD
jgi:putative DNA primase/helicase